MRYNILRCTHGNRKIECEIVDTVMCNNKKELIDEIQSAEKKWNIDKSQYTVNPFISTEKIEE